MPRGRYTALVQLLSLRYPAGHIRYSLGPCRPQTTRRAGSILETWRLFDDVALAPSRRPDSWPHLLPHAAPPGRAGRRAADQGWPEHRARRRVVHLSHGAFTLQAQVPGPAPEPRPGHLIRGRADSGILGAAPSRACDFLQRRGRRPRPRSTEIA